MFRLIYMFIYLCGYLLYSLPYLKKMMKLSLRNDSNDDEKIHRIPKHWGKSFITKAGGNVSVRGTENLPEGPVVFVANHEGNFDIPLTLGYLPKPFGLISKMEVKKIPIVASWMEAMGCIFIDRKNRRQSVNAIKEGTLRVKDGHSMLVFPEGTRSRGNVMAEFKGGSLRLAKDGHVPIVPIAIKGTSDMFEKNNSLIKPANVKLVILPAIYPNQYEQMGMNEVANQIHIEINKELQLG